MDFSHIAIRKLPILVIVSILEKIVRQSFEGFYNYIVAFIQINDTSYVNDILKSFDLGLLFNIRFRDLSSCQVKFNHIFNYAARLDIPDAIFYICYRHLLSTPQDMDEYLARLHKLARDDNHYFSKIIVHVFEYLFKADRKAAAANVLLTMIREDHDKLRSSLITLSRLQVVAVRVSYIHRMDIPDICEQTHELTRERMRFLYGAKQEVPLSDPCDGCVLNRMLRRLIHDFYTTPE